MEPVKNRDRRNLFMCFRPLDVDNHVRVVGNSVLPPSSEYDGGDRKKKKNKNRRSLSGAMKAVFSKASVKKHRGKKTKQEHRPRNDLPSQNEKFVKEFSDPEEIFTNTSNSIITASSRSSSYSSNSGSDRIRGSDYIYLNPTNTKNKQQINIVKDTNHLSIYSPKMSGLCIFLVCLVALVFWGKVIAILACTSTWFFFAPGTCRSQRVDSVVNEVGDSEEDKKRVIMEGLLERNHYWVPY